MSQRRDYLQQQQQYQQVDQQQLPPQIIQLATNLRMQLGIPIQQQINPLDPYFLTQCINVLFVRLNPKWQPIVFQAQNSSQLDQIWRKLFKIVQSTLLNQGEHILQNNQQVGIQNILVLYQVLCQGCQVLRQQEPYLKTKITNQKPQKRNNSKQISNNKQSAKVQNKNKQIKNEKQKSKSKSKSKQKNEKQKIRPATANNNKKPMNTNLAQKSKRQTIIISKNLQEEIIEDVTKTMYKIYNTKAEPKRQARIREKQGTQAVQKAKRRLDYAIKDYQLNNKLTNNKIQQAFSKNKKKDLVDHAYMKTIQTKHKRLNEQIQSEQLKYYIQLRDKKVSYIRHIHKLIEKLQKQRQIQFNKRQKQIQVQKKKSIIQKISNADNLFEHNMQKLQENYQNRRKVQQMQNVGQVEVCRAMEKVMKQKKLKQLQDIQNLWNEQRNQLHRITTDQQKMKNRLIEIYRKYRVK